MGTLGYPPLPVLEALQSTCEFGSKGVGSDVVTWWSGVDFGSLSDASVNRTNFCQKTTPSPEDRGFRLFRLWGSGSPLLLFQPLQQIKG